ncbi:hypothetical protein OJF2_06990 [Aquisphaera giovannonii]|uniref:Uncharacterized protein n=1 Tax=Aquisphaera giovannonii TaxID=406548 RepID=A0A5B9VWZ6_9BACT|nr:hypothetical protein OJF2_06990 [Aquisphaera giovannonii]
MAPFALLIWHVPQEAIRMSPRESLLLFGPIRCLI